MGIVKNKYGTVPLCWSHTCYLPNRLDMAGQNYVKLEKYEQFTYHFKKKKPVLFHAIIQSANKLTDKAQELQFFVHITCCIRIKDCSVPSQMGWFEYFRNC